MTSVKPKIILTGKRFGFWTVLHFDPDCPKRDNKWICRCKCGLEKSVQAWGLKDGRSRSCGCSGGMGSQVSHGLNGTVIHRAWCHIRHRCLNPKYETYRYYGGRGIRVCEFIRQSPKHLLTVIGDRPRRTLSIDRVNNNGNYSCGSCPDCLSHGWSMNLRWATRKQQARNKRSRAFMSLPNPSIYD